MKKSSKNAERAIEFSQRLAFEMTHAGLSQASIASRLEISQGAVSGWFNRGFIPQPRILKGLADMLGVTPEWLLSGREPKLSERSRLLGERVFKTLPVPGASQIPIEEHSGGGSSLKEVPQEYRERQVQWIPLISWAQAGIATAFEQIPEEWQERIPAVVNDTTAFAISIRGDSMEPKYHEGDVAVLLPRTPARNGDLVVANIKGEGFLLKILTLVGGDPTRLKLTSYNPAYPPMEFSREQFHWIYPVHSVNKLIRR